MSDQTAPPAATLSAATAQATFPARGPALLGTMHGPDSARALLRLDGGEIRRVETGERVAGATVAAIGEGVVILSDGRHAQRLEMPPS